VVRQSSAQLILFHFLFFFPLSSSFKERKFAAHRRKKKLVEEAEESEYSRSNNKDLQVYSVDPCIQTAVHFTKRTGGPRLSNLSTPCAKKKKKNRDGGRRSVKRANRRSKNRGGARITESLQSPRMRECK